ncbi:MAG TPA: acyltransferase [Verrucomicrobiota bacterium]|nr:acyltransferase [Verrucomicrobiota bacterium]
MMDCPAEFRPGTLLKEAALRHWLAGCGRGVKVYAGCRICPPDQVWIGDRSQIDEEVWIFAGQGVRIGKHVHLAFRSSISGGGECVLEDFVGIGSGARLITGTENVDGSGLTNPTIPDRWRAVMRGRIRIGAHALVFTGAVVLPDVTIGEGAVVAAGAVVHRDLKPWGIYAGSPLVQVGVRPPEKILEAARQVLEASS